MNTNLPVKAHARLGASTASRWMECPGSVRLSANVPNVESEFAREGTAAHALAELCLRRGVQPADYIGMTLEGFEITEEMAGFVSIFVEYCNGLAEQAKQTWIEQQFSLGAINPPEPMFGTTDFMAYIPAEKELHVVDLKYGQGVVVEVKGNKQARFYALGGMLSLAGVDVQRVVITIVQPRARHTDGIIRSEAIDPLDLLGFSGVLLDAARATQAPDAPLHAGDHCRFCPVAGRCPELLRHAQAVARVEFADLPVDVPPAPETLPVEVLGSMMQQLPILEGWIKAMYAHAQAALERGEAIPGLKLVAKRARRYWINEAQVEHWMQGHGYAIEEFTDSKLKSPAQMEAMMGKAKRDLPAEFIDKRSSGVTVVPESDSRDAVSLAPEDVFPALSPGETL